MPCENNHSAICNSTQRIYFAGYIVHDFCELLKYIALRSIFFYENSTFQKLPVTYSYEDLYSTMIDIYHYFRVTFEYKHFWFKIMDHITTSYTIEADYIKLNQYFLCKGLLILIILLLHVQAINRILFVNSGDYKNHSRSIEMETRNGIYGLLVGFSLGCLLVTLAILLWYKHNLTIGPHNSSTEDKLA